MVVIIDCKVDKTEKVCEKGQRVNLALKYYLRKNSGGKKMCIDFAIGGEKVVVANQRFSRVNSFMQQGLGREKSQSCVNL